MDEQCEEQYLKTDVGVDVVPLQCYNYDRHGPRCRDTDGYFERAEFERWTCSKCFVHIFDMILHDDGRPPLAYDSTLRLGTSLYSMISSNITAHEPDALQENSAVCQNYLKDEQCARWRGCCYAAVQCCERQLAAGPSGVVPRCRMTWDGFACWNVTEPNTLAQQACPDYYQSVGTFHSSLLLATKMCTADGWFNNYSSTAPLEWTNHTLCVGDESMAKAVLRATSTLSVFFHSVSILILLLCLAILLLCRNIGSDITRLMLKVHCMLFFAFECLHATLLICETVFYQPALQTRMADSPDSKTWCDSRVQSSACKIVNVVMWYFRGATYCSLLCEVFYLLRRMQVSSKLESFVFYLLTATLLPLLPVGSLVAIRLWQNPPGYCWMIDDTFTLIIYVPNILILLINLIVLIVVQHRVISSYHAAKRYLPNVVVVKRGVKLAGLLLPVFGVQNFIIIYRPEFWIYYEFIEALIIGTQGTIIAIVYCVLNSEIRKELVRMFHKYQRYRQSSGFSHGRYTRAHVKRHSVELASSTRMNSFVSYVAPSKAVPSADPLADLKKDSNYCDRATKGRTTKAPLPDTPKDHGLSPITSSVGDPKILSIVTCKDASNE